METAVIIEHLPSGISGEATERRSQSANRIVAVFRLRLRLALELRSQWVVEGKTAAPPSALWQQRVANGRLVISSEHEDFPAILAEAIDHLAFNSWKLPEASEQLTISATQFIKLLKKHPPAFLQLNDQRQSLGLNSLQ